MKSSRFISTGNRGYLHTTQREFFGQCFQWKVDITYIHRLRPNFEIGSLVGRNLR